MIKYVGYEKYFDFEAIFQTFPMKREDEAKLKKELKAHVPFSVGWHKKCWFKQSDLEVYMTERYPGMVDIHGKLEQYAIMPTILHYAGRDEMFKLLEDHHSALSRLYNRLHYFPNDKEAAEQITRYEAHVYVIRGVLFPELKKCRIARANLDATYKDDYAVELLKTYRGKAWTEHRFDEETTDILKRNDAS